uniref:Mitoferrin-1 n=1 Tax=Sinocyclocheilus anshuiensis TaxID=1608454 RepID=A0A671M289_9TELE
GCVVFVKIYFFNNDVLLSFFNESDKYSECYHFHIKSFSLSLSVVKQRMQMYNSPYRSLYDCVLTVSRKEGLAAFYRSYSTQLTMNIPFQAVHFITYEFMQEHFNPQRQYRPETHILSGAAAGAVSAAITTPLDVCKTLLNTQENMVLSSAHVSGHLSGMVNAARVIYQMPSTAIAWSVYEFFKYFLTQQEPHIQEIGY